MLAGAHEPFIVDDLDARLRLWRCSVCSTLWLEPLGAPPRPASEADADQWLTGWREAEQWIAGTTVQSLLQDHRQGTVSDRMFVVALLHHDVLSTPVDHADTSPLHLFSDHATAQHAGGKGSYEWGSVATLLRWTSGHRPVVLDVAEAWACDLDDGLIEYLDAKGRGTDTRSERERAESTRGD
ncbi:hypothetical protein [Cellulomonas sp. NPDC058312]|uniref:hypothetical protein n=1 Tax=Cellulomonas sp. NPDC058312 TaxID=3346441 RepID=UPI0036EBDE0E